MFFAKPAISHSSGTSGGDGTEQPRERAVPETSTCATELCATSLHVRSLLPMFMLTLPTTSTCTCSHLDGYYQDATITTHVRFLLDGLLSQHCGFAFPIREN